MAEVLSNEIIKKRLEQLDAWGYDHNKEFNNTKLTEFLLQHWEDTENLREVMDDFGSRSVFWHVLPSIGNYITEKNWPIIIKRLIEMSIPEYDESYKENDTYYWLYEEKFRHLYRLLDERTVTYALELVKIRQFYKYAEQIPLLPEEAITDIKNCLGPELIQILKSMPYIPDAIFLIPFMKTLLKLFLQNNINMVYSIDKSGRILGFLFFSVLSSMGLSKRARFYFMNVKQSGMEVILYSEKQKKELAGKNVLLIDDYLDAGTTIVAAQEFLSSVTGKNGKVVPAIFSVAPRFNKKTEMDIYVGGWRGPAYHAVTSALPSWYGKSAFAGVKETEHGPVEVDEGSREMATAVRRAFSNYGKLIAAYLKENMGI